MSLKTPSTYPPRFVVVTHYAPEKLPKPRVHVYGPWDTRAEALKEKRKMERDLRINNPAELKDVTMFVNTIIEDES